MILTCPECATRYFVADDKVGPQGKTVRCASCSHKWTAFPTAEADVAEPSAPPVAPASAPPEPPVAETVAAPEPPTGKPANAAKAIRQQAETRKTVREAVVTGVVWAGMGVAAVGLLAAGLVFRTEVVRTFPRAAGAYAMIGMPVNPTGLVFENVAAQPALQDGHAALVVSGAIRNIEKHAVHAPDIQIQVLDKDGHPVAAKLVDGPDGAIAPGKSHQFVVAVLDPPATADDIEVAFASASKKKGHGKPAKDAHHAPAAAGHEDVHADPHAAAPHGDPVAHGSAPVPAHGPAPASAPAPADSHGGGHGGDAHGAAPAGQHGPSAALRGPSAMMQAQRGVSPQPILEAMEAKPLPPGSRYALPSPHG